MYQFKHYGVEVVYQECEPGEFEEQLRKQKIKYKHLPILDKKIIKYKKDDEVKYAYFAHSTTCDRIFVTTEIPEDMRWENIDLDYRMQSEGEEPMPLVTRARLLYDKAVDIATGIELQKRELFGVTMPPHVSDAGLNMALISLGTSLAEIKRMDHHDVPELDSSRGEKCT